ncbi:MAG: aminomethyltransferase family protein, partial [Chloroflexota bacterium]|nr:aminomethyltransferase family protein [Chloroflexota bacterium]
MSFKNLEEAIQGAGNAVKMLRNSQLGPYVYPVVATEFSNWRDEQRAWQETCVLFNQSYHMADMWIEGPDALKLLSATGVNTFENFPVNKAKQFVPCNYDGFVIGDVILFHLDTDSYLIVGRPAVHNWVQYHAETGGYNVKLQRDERSVARDAPIARRLYRYQIQGPNAPQVLDKLNGGPIPEIKFFNLGEINIAGRKVHALRHGMSGAPGLEIWGPHEEREEIRAAIVEAGREFGLRQVGSRAYATNTLESGWIPSPLPAVYSGEKMKPYRQWLAGNGYEATASLGGSFYSDNVDDYYMTPWDLGYGFFVKFDHDFIGKEALQEIAKSPRRKKVTLAWNGEDVARAYASLFQQGDIAKYIDIPLSNYSAASYDKVLTGGKMVGCSMFAGYSYNERAMLSLAVVDNEYSEVGTQLSLIWGEEGGGSSKPTVERHKQIEIRATVGPVPYAQQAR